MGALAPVCHESVAALRERLILEHMPQVRLIARRIQDRLPQHIGLEDLVSTGVLGLIAAIDNFDPGHNVKLKTYAEYKIRGAILDSLREMDWVPRQKRRKARQIETAVASAEQRLHRAPTEEETAAELRLSLEQLRDWVFEVHAVGIGERVSPPAGEDARGIIEAVPDTEDNLPSTLLERHELRRVLEDAIRKIPPIEQMVLRLYYRQGMTLRQIAQIVRVHESRISQLKTQAILRLRTRMRKTWPVVRAR
jgi:RNA polymerase sigma factor for flagellar operon FliA